MANDQKHIDMLAVTRHARCFLAVAIFCLSVACSNSQVEVEIHDDTPLHIFPPGSAFSFDITVTVASGPIPEGLGYQWRNFRGEPLGPIVHVTPGERTTVTSPVDAPEVGYYGLAFLPNDRSVRFNESSGRRREIGFAVLPERAVSDRTLDPTSPFGVVHANLDDPYLPTWIKTMTWRTTSARWWGYEMQKRRDMGLRELPLVSGDGWTNDDTKRIRGYFEAEPAIEHWELGREENLRSRFEEPFYFANLKAKAAAARRIADEVNPRMRFLYQIAGRSLSDMTSFLESEAAAEFDILAPHPYAWPNFPTPETWLEAFIDERWSEIARTDRNFPMWFTEVGAPQNDADVLLMLSGKSPVWGHTRDEHAAYLVKLHTIALAKGVEKIVWYNYKDRGPSTTDVEDHFGMFDYWGFPKPAYATYVNMTQCLEGKRYQEERHLEGNIRVYEFLGARENCLVAWMHPAATRAVPISTIQSSDDEVISVTDLVGAPVQASPDIELDEHPVFIRVRRDPSSSSH
jgi:hypothetical protein